MLVSVLQTNNRCCWASSIRCFTIFVSNLAIWLASLPFSISVQTTLRASVCHAMPFQPKKRITVKICCGRTRRSQTTFNLLMSNTWGVKGEKRALKPVMSKKKRIQTICKLMADGTYNYVNSLFSECSVLAMKRKLTRCVKVDDLLTQDE